jgi:arabinogalactan oligomer / maltooligosaccharide transport system permease protein
VTVVGKAAPETDRAPSSPPSQRRRGGAPPAAGGTALGWIVKIVLLGMADAVAVTGLFIAAEAEAWGYVTLLAVTLVVVNAVYLPRRYVPLKFLVPGVFFLAVFAMYPVLYTAYSSTTNYGTGHVLSKQQAIDQIQSQSIGRAEGSTAYDATPLAGPDGTFAGFGLFDPETEELFLGTSERLELLTEPAELQVLTTTQRTFVVRVGDLTGVRPGGLATLSGFPANTANYVMPGEAEGSEIRISGGQAFEAGPSRIFDPETETITDLTTGVEYSIVEGRFTSADGQTISPGFQANVGFSNYTEILTSNTYRGAFPRVLLWTIAFAVLSVVTTFAFGLGLAMVLNDKRMRGRKIYRSLVIIPYALPGFMTALVWRGLLNRTFGFNRWLDLDVGWLESPNLARFSLILVNLWLGYPYMFLVCTGALQSIPTDLKEAAFVDGATGFTAFRKITFPLLLTSVSPLLIASFAFNFNNFTIVWLVTGGGPRSSGDSAGATDILLSWTYRIALDAEPKMQGLAAALSVMIFLIVATLSAIGFKYTKTYEEVR